MSITRTLPWCLLVGMIVFAAATYAGLPAEIPTHIDANGIVKNAVPTTAVNWFLLPGIAVLTQALLTWITLLLPSKPQLFNFPDKDRFLALPAKYQRPIIEMMQTTMDIIGALVVLTMAYVQWLLWRTAMGTPQTLGVLGVVVSSVVIAPVALVMTSRISTRVDEQEKRWRANA